MRIGEFAAAAGVSARTVRYYIVEGLLPPPEGAGLGAMYTQAHLDRLRLILRLKDTYLPLKEIRRQLTGLDDAGVRSRLAELEGAGAPVQSRAASVPARSRRTDRAPRDVAEAGSAAEYLQRLSGAEDVASASPAVAPDAFGMRYAADPVSPPKTNPSSSPATPLRASADPDGPFYPGYPPPSSPLSLGRAVPAAMPPEPPAEASIREDADALAEHWVRLRIGDDVELLVRSGAYHRLRDRIDWLLGWARAIFR